MKLNLGSLFCCTKRNKAFFVFLLLFMILAIVLGIFASINFGGGIFTIDLSNIAYIRFLKGNLSLVGAIFLLILSLLIYFLLIYLCCSKTWLLPLAILLFGYFVYSQTVVFVSIIITFGFLNVLLFSLFLLIFLIVVFTIFLLMIIDLLCIMNSSSYFRDSFNKNVSFFLIYLIALLLITCIFVLLLAIMKSFMLLLVY